MGGLDSYPCAGVTLDPRPDTASRHGYTCGTCEWGRSPQNKTYWDYLDHRVETGHDPRPAPDTAHHFVWAEPITGDNCYVCGEPKDKHPRPAPDTAPVVMDDYMAGYRQAQSDLRAGVLALGSVTGIVKASGNWDAFVVRSAVLALLGPEP